MFGIVHNQRYSDMTTQSKYDTLCDGCILQGNIHCIKLKFCVLFIDIISKLYKNSHAKSCNFEIRDYF